MKYEIWVEYRGESSHLHQHRLYEVGRFWTKKGALNFVQGRQAFYDGLAEIRGKEQSDMLMYVCDCKGNRYT